MNERTKALFFVSLSLLLAASTVTPSVQTARKAASDYDDDEGYSVLSVLLDTQGKNRSNSVIQIWPQTASQGEISYHSLEECGKVPSEFREAVNDFHNRAKTSMAVQKKFQTKIRYEIVGEAMSSPSDDARGSEIEIVPAESISSGIYFVSAVGFGKNRSRAVAYVDYKCGLTCGGGAYHFLRKGPRGWHEAKGISSCSWWY